MRNKFLALILGLCTLVSVNSSYAALTELATGLQLGNGAYLPVSTWSSLPSVAGASGKLFSVTDLNGCIVFSNGSYYRPVGGCCVISQDWVASSTTSSTSEVNLKIVNIPANIPSANGSLWVYTTYVATGTNGAKQAFIRWASTSGATSGGIARQPNPSSSTLSFDMWFLFANRNASGTQVTGSSSGYGISNSSGSTTPGSLDTTAATYLNFNGLVSNASDTLAVAGETTQWCEK